MDEKNNTIEHPLEEVLDIDSGSTLIPYTESLPTETVEVELYDEKDTEIDGQIQEIYDAAMSAFEAQMEEAELVEGKYKARNGEVAVQFLNAALSAAREKANLKSHKDKIKVSENKISGGTTIRDSQVVIADRNEILKRLAQSKDTNDT